MYRFLVIIEKGSQSYGAYSPNLPGCVAVGDTQEGVEQNMREAFAMHLQGMIEDQGCDRYFTYCNGYISLTDRCDLCLHAVEFFFHRNNYNFHVRADYTRYCLTTSQNTHKDGKLIVQALVQVLVRYAF